MHFLLGIAASAAFWPDILGASTTPRWAAMAVLIPLILLASRSIDPKRCLGNWGWAILATVGLTILWSPDWRAGADSMVHLMILAGAFVLGSSTPSLRTLWIGFVVGIAFSLAFSASQLAGWPLVVAVNQPSGLFVNKNLMGEAAVVATIAAVGYRMHPALIVTSVLAVLISYSFAAWGALILVGGLVLYRQHRLSGTVAIGSLAATAVAFFAFGYPSAIERADIWAMTIREMTLWGNGLGSFSANHLEREFVHLDALQLVYEQGIFSLALLSLIGITLWRGRHGSIEFYVLAAVVANSCFSFGLQMPATAFAAAVAMGHLARGWDLVRHERDDLGDSVVLAPR